jgi:hypothetical protein
MTTISVAWAQAPGSTVTLTRGNCVLLTRKKFSRSWAASQSRLPVGTAVNVLGPSQLKEGPAYIFEVSDVPRATGFEFKALSSCFSASGVGTQASKKAGASRSNSAAPARASAQPKDSHWEFEGIYAKNLDYFKDKQAKHLDEVSTTAIGLEGRHVKAFSLGGRTSFDLGGGASLAMLSGKTTEATVNSVELSTFAVGLGGLMRFSMDVAADVSIGISVPIQFRWAFWGSSPDGSMSHAMSLRSSLLLHGMLRTATFAPYMAVGLTESLSGLDLRLGAQF